MNVLMGNLGLEVFDKMPAAGFFLDLAAGKLSIVLPIPPHAGSIFNW